MSLPSSEAQCRTSTARRYAIVSMISDNVIGLGATFIASLRETLPQDIQIDLILFTHPTAVPLSQTNRTLISHIFPQVIFHEADASFLTEENTRLDKFVGRDVAVSTKQAPFLKFNLFKLQGYDGVLWLDSDMLAIRNFTEIFRLPHDICVVRSGNSMDDAHFGVAVEKKAKFNAGTMLYRSSVLTQDTFSKLLVLLNDRTNFILRDQPLLNALFRQQMKFFLPHAYNWKLTYTETGWADEDLALKCAKIIHFQGSNKWHLADSASSSPLARRFHELRTRYDIPLILNP
ncbi:MAG: glycosyltransferase [Verrucomicrobiota bacterium]